MNNIIALVGNPNSGKTTLFNRLTGSRQQVGNWPGVTVEKKEGRLKGVAEWIVQDLPGIYSLSPYSLEEVVSRTYLLHERPSLILNIVDSTNLERNLYLTTQLLELEIPVVVALNMVDLVEDQIDIDAFAAHLNCPVVEISALKNQGIEDVLKTVQSRISFKSQRPLTLSSTIEKAIEKIRTLFPDRKASRWYAIKILEGDEEIIKEFSFSKEDLERIAAIRQTIEEDLDDDIESVITSLRYDQVENIVKRCVIKIKSEIRSSCFGSDRSDRDKSRSRFADLSWDHVLGLYDRDGFFAHLDRDDGNRLGQ